MKQGKERERERRRCRMSKRRKAEDDIDKKRLMKNTPPQKRYLEEKVKSDGLPKLTTGD